MKHYVKLNEKWNEWRSLKIILFHFFHILTMDINSLFSKDACDIRGKQSKDRRTRTEYFDNKKILKSKGIKVVLVDMINHPIEDAVPISNELFFQEQHPE